MKTVDTGLKVDTLSVSAETLATIILEARAYDEVVPETDIEDGADEQDERDAPPHDEAIGNPARKVLVEAIRSLSEEQQETLVALAWVGRGDYDVDEWAEALSMAADRDNGQIAIYLAGIPMLADYLEAGAETVGLDLSDTTANSMSH